MGVGVLRGSIAKRPPRGTMIKIMANLLQKYCVPCEGGVPPLNSEKIKEYLKEVPDWQITEEISPKGVKYQLIRREFKFNNFKESIKFVNKVSELAESEGHHPDIHIFYNKVRLDLWTHAIGGLFDNDFILAAKINALI